MRSIPEWIGASDDAQIPTRVKQRIFDRFGGQCYLTHVALTPGTYDFDHIVDLASGGKHCESNIAPIWRGKHREKTAAEATERATIRRKRAKRQGLKKSRNPMPGSKASGWKKLMNGKVVKR